MKLNIGNNIRNFRRNMDITQEQLAEQLGVSYQAISRWENGTTYPDIELLPSLATFFNTSVDQLIGCPENEKEKTAKKTFDDLAQATFEENPDVDKIVSLIRDIRRNYLTYDPFWYFRIYCRQSCLILPEVLSEVRLTYDAFMEKSTDNFKRCTAIGQMAALEEEENMEEFLKKYAFDEDLSSLTLSLYRYRVRGDWKKYEPVRQIYLWNLIDNFIDRINWRSPNKSYSLQEAFNLNKLHLDFLHRICMQQPDKEHPISANGRLDAWILPRLHIGIRHACYLASCSTPEEAFIVLEDTISLLEEAMKVTTPIDLRCTSPWLDKIVWQAEEFWNHPHNLPNEQEERSIYIHREEFSYVRCYVLYPSWYYEMLTAKKGWEWFDPIRNDSHYQQFVERVKKLIVTR